LGRVNRKQENYISRDTGINRSQKTYAKEAVLWLLSLGPQTEEDISEHFGLSMGIVAVIVEELIRTGRIERQAGNRALLALRDPFKKRDIGGDLSGSR